MYHGSSYPRNTQAEEVRHSFFIFFLLLCPAPATAFPQPVLVISDNFPSPNTAWGVFEEIVGGNTACYGDGIAAVSTDNIKNTLEIVANANRSRKSNHVLAQRSFRDRRRSGVHRVCVGANEDRSGV